MTRFLVALVFALCAAASIALPARANTCTVPNTLSNGVVVDANVLNTNFVALQSCGNNIDSTNVGPAGILASQIIAATAAQGTFGGAAVYTFPHGVISGGPISASGSITGTQGIFSSGVSGTTASFSSALTATSGTFSTGVSAANGFTTTSSAPGLTLGNGAGGANSTAVNSNGVALVAGVSNTVFGLTANGVNNELAVDAAGNLGMQGQHITAIGGGHVLPWDEQSPASSSTEHLFRMNTATNVSGVVTIGFSTPYSGTPVCIAVYNSSSATPLYAVPITTSVTIHGAASIGVSVICIGN